MLLAGRNLRHDPTQLSLTITGIGLSVMLVIVLLGVLNGVRLQTADYLTEAPGALVVGAEGMENFFFAPVPLPSAVIAAVQAQDGVGSVVPLLSQQAVLQLHGRREATFVIGYDPALGGGPRQFDGRPPQAAGEIVLGRLLARRHGVGVGDTIDVLGQTYSVTGLSNDPSPLMTSFAFVTKPALEALLLAPGAASILLVTPDAGVAPEMLRDRLAGLPGISVLLKDQVIANDVAVFTEPFEPVIRVMAAIALLAGTLIVGLLIYTMTLQRRREYGVLKALGIRNRTLYRAVGTQALMVAVVGVAAGLALAGLAARTIMLARPEFLISPTWGGMALAAVAGLVMALAASLAPARVIARLAPADVFRR